MGLDQILHDLQRHCRIPHLDRGLGGRLVEHAAASVGANFDARTDPDGSPWPELSGRYARWKAAHFPGQPMGRLHDEMVKGVPGADVPVTPDRAVYEFGRTEQEQLECQWFSEGDPVQNRPPRRFVGLSPEHRAGSDALVRDDFKEQV